MIKKFHEFVKDFNEYYQVNYKVINVNTNDIYEVMFDLYDSDDFEIDYDLELIEIF